MWTMPAISKAHSAAARANGKAFGGRKQRSLDEAKRDFWDKVAIKTKDECWIFGGCKSTNGYGQFGYLGKVIPAHRFAYMIAYSEHPGELKVLHKCDNPPCVNPNHLSLGTQKDNVCDCRLKKRNVNPPKPTYILSSRQVEEIKSKHKRYVYTVPMLAAEYGVSLSTIGKALRS